MSEEPFNLIIGLLISLAGILVTIHAFLNQPDKDENVFGKSANIQLKIIGVTAFICGLTWAFR